MTQNLIFPQSGQVAPRFCLPATDGSLMELETYPKPIAMTFLRHLA